MSDQFDEYDEEHYDNYDLEYELEYYMMLDVSLYL